MPENDDTRPTGSSIPGVEAGDTLRNITHSAPHLTRGSDEQYQARVDEATARYERLTGRSL